MRLTARETEVMAVLAEGLTWEAAANRLGISRNTLSKHRANISEKLGYGSTIDLLRALGWLRVPDYLRTSGSDVNPTGDSSESPCLCGGRDDRATKRVAATPTSSPSVAA